MKKATLTLCVGEKYIKLFDEYCRSNWTDYCAMLDFDLIVIDTNLDTLERSLKRSPSWQKLLIFLNHGQVNGSNVWVDTDVIINTNSAYDITNEIPLEKVASVDQYGYSNKRNN